VLKISLHRKKSVFWGQEGKKGKGLLDSNDPFQMRKGRVGSEKKGGNRGLQRGKRGREEMGGRGDKSKGKGGGVTEGKGNKELEPGTDLQVGKTTNRKKR